MIGQILMHTYYKNVSGNGFVDDSAEACHEVEREKEFLLFL